MMLDENCVESCRQLADTAMSVLQTYATLSRVTKNFEAACGWRHLTLMTFYNPVEYTSNTRRTAV